MEKFSGWNDKTSGVNPFVPAKDPCTSTTGGLILRTVCMGPLAVLRVTLAVLLAVLLVVPSLICTLLPVQPVRRIVRLVIESSLCRLIMGSLAFSIRTSSPRPMAVKLRPSPTTVSKYALSAGSSSTAARTSFRAPVRSGDIIVSNFTSFVDVLYFSFAHAPTFAFPAKDGGVVTYSGVLGALRASVSPPPATAPPLTAARLQALTSGVWPNPVVLFAEGARSNNKAVLRMDVLDTVATAVLGIDNRSKRPTVHAVFVQRPAWDCHVVGSAFAHLVKLSIHVMNRMSVHSMPDAYTPQPADADPGSEVKYADTLRAALVQLFRGTRGVDFGMNDYSEFVEFYVDYGNKEGKKKQA